MSADIFSYITKKPNNTYRYKHKNFRIKAKEKQMQFKNNIRNNIINKWHVYIKIKKGKYIKSKRKLGKSPSKNIA